MSIADNLTMSHLKPYSKVGVLQLRRRRAAVRDWMHRLSVKARGPDQTIGQLSGGNQQKVAIARAAGVITQEHIAARELLRGAMAAGGFVGIATEWWHFDHGDREQVRRDFPRVV